MKESYQTLELPGQAGPSKQEWALINQYKALQFDSLRQKERLVEQEKKHHFRQQLDQQRHNKNDVNQQQREADRRYHEFITKKAQQIKERENNQKQTKVSLRKQMEQQNQHFIQEHLNSRVKDRDSGYHLEIGIKSEQERKNKSEVYKKQMMDTLDIQIKDKQERKKNQKQKTQEVEHKNLMYQYNYFDSRNPYPKIREQNQNTYKLYEQVVENRHLRQKQLQRAYVQKPAQIKIKEEQSRSQREQLRKKEQTQDIKMALNKQIKEHNHRKTEQARVNPQDFSYGIMSNIFREKPQAYNKHQYYQELHQQMQEQQNKKKKTNFMSVEEYKLNMNQLSKAVNGDYNHKSYIDRSLGVIGDGKQSNTEQMHKKLNDKDADSIKHRLQILNTQHRNDRMLPED